MERGGDDVDAPHYASSRRDLPPSTDPHSGSTLSDVDGVLAERIRASDRGAVRELFDAYFPLLVGYAASIMDSRPAAEDVVADIFVSIMEHPERVVPTHSLRAYLLWRVRHRALDVLRGQRRDEVRHQTLAHACDAAVVLTTPVPPDQLLEAAEQGDLRARRMAQALATLDATARTIVLWRLRDELDYAEIAHVLGISRAAVKMRFSRALGQIRSHLDNLG